MSEQEIIFRFRSREYTTDDLGDIRRVIAQNFDQGRTYISCVLARKLDWRQPNGKFKEFAVRDTLLRMEESGLIELPPRKIYNNRNKAYKPVQAPLFNKTPLEGIVKDYPEVCVFQATGCYRAIWKYLLWRYHYLGVPRVVGAHLCQVATMGEQVVACLAWASAAWKIAPRDQFIGWDEDIKRRNLHLVVSNVRFLIPPWIRIKHLASRALVPNGSVFMATRYIWLKPLWMFPVSREPPTIKQGTGKALNRYVSPDSQRMLIVICPFNKIFCILQISLTRRNCKKS